MTAPVPGQTARPVPDGAEPATAVPPGREPRRRAPTVREEGTVRVLSSEPRTPPRATDPEARTAPDEVTRISIGRIEVRVTPPATPAAPAAAPAPLARPRQSLDDYLAARDRGRR